jgi:tetratricopeptide (TPR) repeat protein
MPQSSNQPRQFPKSSAAWNWQIAHNRSFDNTFALDKLFGTQIPEWQSWRLKSIVLQTLEDYPAAYTALEKAEKLREPSRRGAMMSQFVDDMLKQKEYTLAQKSAKFLMTETSGGFERTARQRLAAALRGMGDFNSAIAHLDTLVGAGKPQVSQEAAILLAQIYLEDMHEPQKQKGNRSFTGTYGAGKNFNLVKTA